MFSNSFWARKEGGRRERDGKDGSSAGRRRGREVGTDVFINFDRSFSKLVNYVVDLVLLALRVLIQAG